MNNALKFLSGSAATYFLMAACSAASGGPSAHSTGGTDQVASGGAAPAGGATSPDETHDAGSGVAGSPHAAGGGAGMLSMMMDPVPDASAEPTTDGTRLKAIYTVGTDGSRQQQYNWWDSERKEECYFAAFSDGTLRCVPSATGAMGVFFSDSGCSTALFYSVNSQCQGAAKYAMGTAAFACGAVTYPAVYTLTASTPAQVFQGAPASCSAVPAAQLATYSFYTGTPIVLSAFVSGKKEHG